MDSLKGENWFVQGSINETGFALIKLRINKDANRNDVMGKLVKMLKQDIEIVEGATIDEIYFENFDTVKIRKALKDRIKDLFDNDFKQARDSILNMIDHAQ